MMLLMLSFASADLDLWLVSSDKFSYPITSLTYFSVAPVNISLIFLELLALTSKYKIFSESASFSASSKVTSRWADKSSLLPTRTIIDFSFLF